MSHPLCAIFLQVKLIIIISTWREWELQDLEFKNLQLTTASALDSTGIAVRMVLNRFWSKLCIPNFGEDLIWPVLFLDELNRTSECRTSKHITSEMEGDSKIQDQFPGFQSVESTHCESRIAQSERSLSHRLLIGEIINRALRNPNRAMTNTLIGVIDWPNKRSNDSISVTWRAIEVKVNFEALRRLEVYTNFNITMLFLYAEWWSWMMKLNVEVECWRWTLELIAGAKYWS